MFYSKKRPIFCRGPASLSLIDSDVFARYDAAMLLCETPQNRRNPSSLGAIKPSPVGGATKHCCCCDEKPDLAGGCGPPGPGPPRYSCIKSRTRADSRARIWLCSRFLTCEAADCDNMRPLASYLWQFSFSAFFALNLEKKKFNKSRQHPKGFRGGPPPTY